MEPHKALVVLLKQVVTQNNPISDEKKNCYPSNPYLVEDGEAIPAEALDQGHEGRRDQLRARVQVDRVAVPLHHEVPTSF